MSHVIPLSSSWRRQKAHNLVDKAPAGYVCEIRPPRRTKDQSDKMWAMLSDVSRAKPLGRSHTPEVWKELFMHACGHATQFEMGLNGQPFPVGFRSSRLSKAEMADLITFIEAWGAENGVTFSE